MKRILDVGGSLFGLFFLLLITPFIALAIIAEDGLPIFIKLNRVSAGGVIGAYKFRSMIKDAHKKREGLLHLNERNDGPFFKIKNDPRITKVGKFLRRTRIDECPQLINVLRGELSLVGPRPHESKEIERYPEEFKKITMIKSGLTGLSQINGASTLPFRKELEYDLHYLENQSLRLDLKILLKTLKIFLTDLNGL